MSQINKLIEKLCPNGLERKSLGDVCVINKGVQLNKEEMSEVGSYPVINGGILPSGYVEVYNQPQQTITISQGGASAGYVNWLNTKFWAGAHCYVVVPNEKIVSKRFVFHFVKSIECKLQECQYGAGIPALAKKTIEDFQIPLPPLEIQNRIVEILDHFTNLTANLTAELNLRRKQFEHYREKLLSLDSVPGVEWKKLGDVASVYDGTHQTPQYTQSGIPFISVENIRDIYNSQKYISKEAFDAYKIKPIVGDVFLTRIGSIGECAVFNKQVDIAYYVSLALIRPKESVDSYYIKYILESNIGKLELRKKTLLTAVPIKINKDDIPKVKIPLPPLAVQQSIVEKLDKFTALIGNIEKELDLRQKQYEYYREQLLSFPNS